MNFHVKLFFRKVAKWTGRPIQKMLPNDFTPGRPLRAYDAKGNWTDYSTDDLVGFDLNHFKSWKCGAGIRNLSINMDGKVFAATCHVGGLYGNIFSDFSIPSDWVDCPMERCTCGADLFIPKYKKSKRLLKKTQGDSTNFKRRLETRKIEMRAIERTHFSKHKQVYWEIGRRCNYNCSYCGPSHHNKLDRHRTLEELFEATERLFNQFAKGEVVNFIISGGEPTINPALLPWVKMLKSKGHHISIHSNGSRNSEYYRELIKYTDLNLSIHFEFWKEQKLLENVRAILEEKIAARNQNVGHLELKIMMPPHRYSETLRLENSLREIPGFSNYCTWSVVPIRGGDRLEQVVDGYEEKHKMLFGDRH